MRQLAFLAVVLLVTGTALAQDWEGDLVGAEATGDLHGMVGVTWDSQFMWRGFDLYDDKSAVHLLADLNLFDTGFGMSALGHRANSSGFEKAERWDYTLYYQNGLFQGESYATNFRVGWVYYNFPQRNQGESMDLQEGQAVLSWPSLLPIKGLCPSYVLVKLWPSDSGSRLPASASGFLHIFMLDYGFTVPGVLEGMPEHLIRLHAELVYNDGVTPTPTSPNPDHDFSNAVFGVATDLDLGNSITLTPSVYYQTRLNDTITNDSDEIWASVGLKYSF